MSEEPAAGASGPDSREIAKSLRGKKPPYVCPYCSREYRSHTGIMYHIGQFGPPCKLPRCLSDQGVPSTSSAASSPKLPGTAPGSPATGGPIKKTKIPRRDLTWAEAQLIVEFDFDAHYQRLEIDTEIDTEQPATAATEDDAVGKKKGTGSKTPQKRGAGFTPRGRSGKNKGKRKSKLKTPGGGGGGKGDFVPLPAAEIHVLEGVESPDAPTRSNSYYRFVEMSAEDLDELVEYDIDEEDSQWLQLVNEDRKQQGLTAVPQEAFEILMDRLEKECFFESRTMGDCNDVSMYNIDENAVCVICNDGECHNTNAILFCDMCNLAIHQECYGVPYIPEGQWLCRRCLQSPSRSVDCVFCPSKAGAFKQTLDGRWAHVVCALWIPEVQFANPVFLEPIDGIKEIPMARWKLTCQVCRRRMGACIQCAKQNCYAAFHVTCAQQGGLQMKVEAQKNGEVKKMAYCRLHSQKKRRGNKGKGGGVAAAIDDLLGEEDEREGSKESEAQNDGGAENDEKDGEAEEGERNGEGAGKTANIDKEDVVGSSTTIEKRSLEDKKSSTLPVVNIPYVPQHRLDRIIGRVSLHKKSQFIPKLVSYWKLKRQSRNGVPLLRRMQASNHGQRTATNLTEEEREVLAKQLSQWKTLRHDLERARLLAELVRKREKLKREQLRLLQQTNELQLCPINTVMKRILDRLSRKDPADIFAETVNIEEVPDYLDVITQPMDFGTMRKRVDSHHYQSLDEFESDFYLVWHNATVYNAKDTIYYRAAIRIKDAGEKILQQAREQVETADISPNTGLHDPDVAEPPPLTPGTIAKSVTITEEMLENDDLEAMVEEDVKKYRDRLPSATLDEQIEYLEEKLEIIQGQYTGYTLKRKEKNLRQQLNAVRRQLRQQKPRTSDSDDQASSPRRPPPTSTPRNAEGLASHVLHGSLRLTPSRQQILSHSGISLPDGPPKLLSTRNKKRDPPGSGGEEEEEDEEEEEEDEEEEESAVDEEEEEEDKVEKEEKRERRNGVEQELESEKMDSGENEGMSAMQLKKANDAYIQQIKKRAHKIQKQKVQRLAAARKCRERQTTARRRRRTTNPQTGEEEEREDVQPAAVLSDTSLSQTRQRRLRGSYSSTRSGFGSSSSIVDVTMGGAGAEFSGEERSIMSPLSDPGLYHNRHHKLDTHSIPSASSLEDLTVKSPLSSSKQRERNRQHSRTPARGGAAGGGGGAREKIGEEASESTERGRRGGRGKAGRGRVEGETETGGGEGATAGKEKEGERRRRDRKRSRRGEVGSTARKRKKMTDKKNSGLVNGVVNGNPEYKVVLWDLVWAKCRGYPPYPALVVDPGMSRKGLIVNGERIHPPSHEVLEIQKKMPGAPHLVRFFDGKRSWQWLPEEKIERLGATPEQDAIKIAMSGHSKRSVQQAFQRAKQYLKKVESRAYPQIVENDSETEDSDS